MQIISLESLLSAKIKKEIQCELKAHLGNDKYQLVYGHIYKSNYVPSNYDRPGHIIRILCIYYQVGADKIVSKSRKKPYIEYKQLARFLLNKYTDLSLGNIASKTGLTTKDHASVIYSIKIVRERLINPAYLNEVDKIEQQIVKALKLK